jgi:basic amino acid/polyamine antiporter, APA family
MGATLERTLRLRDMTLLVIGVVIGSGIFIVPATVLRQTEGRFGLALLVWFLAGVLSLLGALTYGELGAMDPQSGGIYVYLRDAFGRFPAFLFGWTLFFVIGSGAQATLSVAFAAYAGEVVPLGAFASRAVALGMIAVLAVLNVLGTRAAVQVQNWTTAIKVAALLAMSGALLLYAPAPLAAADFPTSWSPSVLSATGAALIGVLWAYEGWQWATFSAGEAVDPQRTFPLGIAIGTAALVVLYCLANVAYVAALGPAGAAAADGIAAAAVAAVFGPAAGKLVALAILISIFSAANATLLTAPRVFFAMARDGVFFRSLATIHPRFGTPALAIVAGALWAMVLAATGTFEQLLTYVVFTGWLFYALGAASIFVYRRRQPAAARPFRVPAYPLTPLLFVVAAVAIVVNAVFARPQEALVGIAVVLLGAPAYALWRTRVRPPAPRG